MSANFCELFFAVTDWSDVGLGFVVGFLLCVVATVIFLIVFAKKGTRP